MHEGFFVAEARALRKVNVKPESAPLLREFDENVCSQITKSYSGSSPTLRRPKCKLQFVRYPARCASASQVVDHAGGVCSEWTHGLFNIDQTRMTDQAPMFSIVNWFSRKA